MKEYYTKLTVAYVICLLLIAVFSFGTYALNREIVLAEKSSAAMINISGRQRMLSQRIAFLTNRLLAGGPEAERRAARQQLRVAIMELERGHARIKEELKNSDSKQTENIRQIFYSEAANLDQLINEYIVNARSIYRLSEKPLRGDEEVVRLVTGYALHKLLPLLDNVTNAFQLNSEGHVNKLRHIQTIGIFAILVLLVAEGALIFRPLAGLMRQEANNLVIRNDALQKLSNLDGLTGIPNRRYFQEYVEQTWLTRSNEEISIIMADLDFFKNYNDTYGHLAGDECLQRVAQLLHNLVFEQQALAARYGGEEFIIVLPFAKFKAAKAIAETIVREVKLLNIEHKTSEAARVITVSVGVAAKRITPGDVPEELIKAADQALYEAKTLGRNQVVAVFKNEKA